MLNLVAKHISPRVYDFATDFTSLAMSDVTDPRKRYALKVTFLVYPNDSYIMQLWQAIVLGIVQGLTEFLPISSTAHLRITPDVLGFRDPGAGFTAIIQLGTLLSVLWYFRADITRLLLAWVGGLLQGRPLATHEARLGWLIIAATVPIVVAGLALKPWIKGDAAPLRTLTMVAVQLLAGSVLMFAAEWFAARRARASLAGKSLEQLGPLQVLGTGLFQCLALLPGMSRSGSTISGGLLLDMRRETAARFSFLLSLPAISAAGIYSLWDDAIKPWRAGESGLFDTQADVINLVVSTVVSAIVGYLAIAFLMNYLRTRSMGIFIVYRVLLAAALFVAIHQQWLK
jgi:undecaprenyl-diphosphatase